VGEGPGHLAIFGRSDRTWEEKIYRREEAYRGRRIISLGVLSEKGLPNPRQALAFQLN